MLTHDNVFICMFVNMNYQTALICLCMPTVKLNPITWFFHVTFNLTGIVLSYLFNFPEALLTHILTNTFWYSQSLLSQQQLYKCSRHQWASHVLIMNWGLITEALPGWGYLCMQPRCSALLSLERSSLSRCDALFTSARRSGENAADTISTVWKVLQS